MSTRAMPMRAHGLSWRREVGLFVAAYVAYSLARGATTGSFETALANARTIVEIQAAWGIGIERALQDQFIGLPIMWVVNRLYLIAQFAVVPAALIWVYRRRPLLYPRLRTTVLATWVIALPVYALFPTAPPRLAGIGILDTVSEQTSFELDAPFVTAFYNPVAAVPSLHAGFAFAVGIGVASASRVGWIKVGALLWGPCVAFIVVATGNHFVLDVVIGMLAVLLGYMVALLLHRGPTSVVEEAERVAVGRTGAAAPSRDPLRVALVCPYDWSRPGGVRTHVAGLADALRSRGHQVDILAAGRTTGSGDGLVLMGAPVPVRANGSVARVSLGPGAALRMRRALRDGGYDVVHLHEPLAPLVCLVALRSRDAALAATFHMYSARAIPYRLFGFALRPLLGGVSERIAVSEAARECAARVSRAEIAVIPNGVTPAAGEARAVEPDDPSRDRRILFIGRHEPRKGLSVLLDAVERLPMGVRVDLIGVAPEEVADRDMGDRLVAHGRVTDEERRALLARADVLCAPSLGGESFGLVLVEAMAAGVPVVASGIRGYREVLAPDGGILVPPGDPAALAGALTEALTDPGVRDRARIAGPAATAAFEWPRVARLVEDSYRSAIEAHAPAPAIRREPSTA